MLELVFVQGSDRGKVVPLTFEQAWFGQQSNCDFLLRGEAISPVHFGVVRRGDNYVLTDHKSLSGTFLNRVLTTEAVLAAGDQISAGPHVLVVRECAETSPACRFVVERAGGTGAVQVFAGNTLLLGRRHSCQVHLPEPGLAAIHAEVEQGPEGVWITDRSHGAGLSVNGKRTIRQKLQEGDRVRIDPYEIDIRMGEDWCELVVRQVKPGLPVRVPLSDLIPSRFRARALLITLLAVLGFASYAMVARGHSFVSPGPLTSVHETTAAGCASCHVGFRGVTAEACQRCHGAVRPLQRAAGSQRHEHTGLACMSCHSEHRGRDFDVARDVGDGCQAAGCHVTVHERQKPFAAGAKWPVAVAFEAQFENLDAKPEDPLHRKHRKAEGDCAACHTNGDAHIQVARTVMRERCLGCHGVGPEATLGERCSSCHFEHPTASERVLRPKVRRAGLASGGGSLGMLLMAAALLGGPLLYFVAIGLRLRHDRK